MIKKTIAVCSILFLLAQMFYLADTASAAKRYVIVQESVVKFNGKAVRKR